MWMDGSGFIWIFSVVVLDKPKDFFFFFFSNIHQFLEIVAPLSSSPAKARTAEWLIFQKSAHLWDLLALQVGNLARKTNCSFIASGLGQFEVCLVSCAGGAVLPGCKLTTTSSGLSCSCCSEMIWFMGCAETNSSGYCGNTQMGFFLFKVQ